MWGSTLPLAILASIILLSGFTFSLESSKRKWFERFLHFLLTLPFIALLFLFINSETSYHYVWQYGGADLPLRYRISAVWAAREGPLLLWAAFLAIVVYCWRNPRIGESKKQHESRLRFMWGFTLLLLLIAEILDPFRKALNPNWPSSGLNALLQTDLMIFHPPLIFLFYTFCISLGARSISTLLHPDENDSELSKRLTEAARPALLTGTLSVGLGGLWAYTVLDWGGYWAWDPVETGSLLPWLAVVVLLHLHIKPGKASDLLYAGAGLMAAFTAIFATTVTRASGVWASSVHTFVNDDAGEVSKYAWDRLMTLSTDYSAGVEVIAYVQVMLLIVSIWFSAVLCKSVGANIPKGFGLSGLLLLIVPSLAAMNTFFSGESILYWDGISPLIIALVGLIPLVWIVFHLWASGIGLLMRDPTRLLLIPASIAVAYWLGDPIVGFISVLIVIAHQVQEKPSEEYGWMGAGVILWIFASWAQIADVIVAASGMGIMLAPVLLAPPPEDDESLAFFTRKGQMKIVFSAPVILVSSFLLLAWLLLLNSLDRTQLEAHEFYGSPLILLLVLALMVYSWRRSVPAERIAWYVSGIVCISIVLAWFMSDSLPGDSESAFIGPFSRGQLAWFMLPALLISLPAMGFEVVVRGKSLRDGRNNTRGRQTRWIGLGSQLVHIGLIILLIGHVFATTLVDRGDVGHRLSLPLDEPVEVGNFLLVFTGFELSMQGDVEFDSRFDVGERYAGAVVEVYEASNVNSNGELGAPIAILEPGVLRFSSGLPRSEVAILSGATGDLIIIFDLSQAEELGQAMSNDELDQIQRVRVTAYDLPGSHLVWLGWGIMMIGMLMTQQVWWRSEEGKCLSSQPGFEGTKTLDSGEE
jgi:cytochrome c-type biogenesis protein CcmF